MEKVPQIVTERLRAMNVAVNHPDANTLTAFAERNLSPVERASVIVHLGDCSECREIVALALPIAEADQPIVRAPKPVWFAWPVLRWGVIAAGIIVVGSFGIIQYRQRREVSSTMASKAQESFAKEAKNVAPAVPAPAAPNQDKQPTPSSLPSDQAALNPATAGASGTTAAPASGTTLVRDHPVARTLQLGPHVQAQNLNSFQSQTSAFSAPPSAAARVQVKQSAGNMPASAQPETVEVASSPVAANNETASLDAGAAPLEAQSGLRQLNSRVERSKPAVNNTQALAAGKVIGGPLPATVVSVNPFASVQWNVDPSGALQRSMDQGNTWEKVDVTAIVASAPSEALHGAAKDAISNSQRKDSLKKEVTTPLFRAVASNGPDVWAAASGGLLYHSNDAGQHWTRVVPASSNARLTGDIVSLEFPDPQHGRVVTSVPEVWTTVDGGQTWLKQ
ncbi:MAG TPA: YCF48-related protein [Candidatus Eisenbacteria bacterium]|nr:YCF48-related protein [Candidatus Eisenbacteria bacterium]